MRVLRMAPDERVRLFDGQGGEWLGTIRSISRSGVSVRVTAYAAREVEAPLEVMLAQGISSRERMYFTLEQAVKSFLQQSRAAAERLSELLDTPVEPGHGHKLPKMPRHSKS